MRKCKECGKVICGGKSRIAWYGNTPGGVLVIPGGNHHGAPRGRWVLRLCQYCYRWKFPRRKMWDLPPLRQGSERLLSWSERRQMEWAGFNPKVWSDEFREEVEDYRSAIMRGEIRI